MGVSTKTDSFFLLLLLPFDVCSGWDTHIRIRTCTYIPKYSFSCLYYNVRVAKGLKNDGWINLELGTFRKRKCFQYGTVPPVDVRQLYAIAPIVYRMGLLECCKSNETHASNFTEQMTNFPVKCVCIMNEHLHIKRSIPYRRNQWIHGIIIQKEKGVTVTIFLNFRSGSGE